jgi:hypothetical protein
MADVTAPSAASAAGQADKGTKPPKPDEDLFNKDLEKAEKEHKAVMVKLVCESFASSTARRLQHLAPRRLGQSSALRAVAGSIGQPKLTIDTR